VRTKVDVTRQKNDVVVAVNVFGDDRQREREKAGGGGRGYVRVRSSLIEDLRSRESCRRERCGVSGRRGRRAGGSLCVDFMHRVCAASIDSFARPLPQGGGRNVPSMMDSSNVNGMLSKNTGEFGI
jgi:hypothetical protein